MDQATRGIPGPPGHVPMAPSRWQGRRCSWRRAEASAVNQYHFIPLSSRTLPPSARTLLASDILFFDVSKLYFQDIGTRWSLPACTMALDQQIQSSILPSCHDLPHVSLRYIFAVLKKRFLEFANGVSDTAWDRLTGLVSPSEFACFLASGRFWGTSAALEDMEAVTLPGSV